jgi:rhamnogalacturonyl hydrolase YesR
MNLTDEDKISSELRIHLIEEAIKEYKKHNSGFNDQLTELMYHTYHKKQEWEFLVQQLNKKPTEWDLDMIMHI